MVSKLRQPGIQPARWPAIDDFLSRWCQDGLPVVRDGVAIVGFALVTGFPLWGRTRFILFWGNSLRVRIYIIGGICGLSADIPQIALALTVGGAAALGLFINNGGRDGGVRQARKCNDVSK